MAEKDRTDSTEVEAAPSVDHAYWDVPGETLKVIYSLQLFHEIDFAVNEGYRKIPHGGIEVAGLLFGTIDGESVRIEAFRDIDCEHAAGPSLSLSERDLTELRKQITASASDSELKGLTPVGWFLARTRGPMEQTDVEAKQFDEFFTRPFQLSVLVKPERFQPTRFGFLVRKMNGQMPRDATATAVILPLPGRSHKSGQLIASLPAPAPSSNAKRAIKAARAKESRGSPKVPVDDFDDEIADVKPASLSNAKTPEVKKIPEPVPLSIWKVPPDDESDAEEDSALSEPEQTAAEKAARRQLSKDRARVIEQAFPVAPSAPAIEPFRPPSLPSLPAKAAIPVPSAYDRYPRPTQDYAPPVAMPESVLNPRSVTALALAALLGCLVGYVAYLQLPAPVIPIDVRSVNQTVVVSWPPEETRNSLYAAIRLNDGPPVPLSADEKRSGQVSLTATKEFKVEVLARNWIRDSRGIVRYLHAANGSAQVVPADSPAVP